MSSTIPTEDSVTTAANVTLGPDWLRSKPVAVFSKYRYGQEEMLGLWTFAQSCPNTILQIPELGANEPQKPVSISQYTDEEKDSYQPRTGLTSMSSDRGRGRTSDRGRGRGVGVQRGTRRSFEPNTRYYEKPDTRSADSDNWRRRDPDPVPDADFENTAEQPPSYPPYPGKDTEQPPSYPPYPSKGFSPKIDNRETNSWKRTEPEPAPAEPPHSAESPTREESSHFTGAQADSPETMLRNISKTLYRDISSENQPEPFTTPSLFSSFTETQGNVASSGQAPGNISSHLPSSTPSIATPTAISTTAMDMPSLFNRDSVSPQPYTAPPPPYSSPPFTSSQTFPSLSEIGNSLQSNQVTETFRGQGFMPPPQSTQHNYVPSLPTPPPQPTVDKLQPYRSDEMWFYLDPKGHSQGPFDSVKMFSWFREGYFGMDLEIRRATEQSFTMLETMISKCGRIPFQPDDKPSPPPGGPPQQHLPGIQRSNNTPQQQQQSPAWTSVTSIWGNADSDTLVDSVANNGPGNTNFIPSGFLNDATSLKAQRAEEMRKEIERAMAIEQQRKHHEMEVYSTKMEEEKKEKEQFLHAQRQMMEAKLVEEQKQKEEEMRRFREEEMKKSKLFEEETERIRQEKDRLERERIIQAEKVRIELEEAEKARQALAQERIKLERERQLVKQKEEELMQRAKSEKMKLLEEARVADERRAAQQAAAEAKAMAKAMDEANAAAIREARRQADAKKQEDAWAKEIREQENAWSAPSPPEVKWNKACSPPQNPWSTPAPAHEANPWAHIPQTNMTKSSTRTPVPTTKGWGKPAHQSPSVPLSQIQQAEVERKRSSGGNIQKSYPSEPAVARPASWGAQKQPTKARSLADIQREEERRSTQHQNYTNAQQNDWNPVAGMMDDDSKQKKQQQKAMPKAQKQKPPQQQKAQPKKSKAPAPLLDMFATNDPKDEFTIWCEAQVSSFKNQHIDVPTFISFLRDVESPREVREYVVSYLGDTLSTDRFIQEFLSKRKTAKGCDVAAAGLLPGNAKKGNTAAAPQPPQAQSRKGKRKKMQKVNAASLLGINCTASSDARNRGDIDTIVTT